MDATRIPRRQIGNQTNNGKLEVPLKPLVIRFNLFSPRPMARASSADVAAILFAAHGLCSVGSAAHRR
jgi:hypothetical protein